MKFFSKMSIRQKIVTYFAILIIVPFIFLGYIQISISSNEVELILSQNTTQMLEQVELVTEFYIAELSSLLFLTENDENIKKFLTGDYPPNTSIKISDYLNILEKSKNGVLGSLVINSDGEYIGNHLQPLSRDSLARDLWYNYAIASPDEVIFISNPIGRNLATDNNYNTDQIISAVKAISDDKGYITGVILFDFSLEELEKKISSITLGTEGFIYIVDQRGDIFYAPHNKIVQRIDNRSIINNNNAKNIIEVNDNLYQVMKHSTNTNNWNIMGVFLYDDITQVVDKLKYFTLLIFVATLFFAFIFSKIFDKILIKPIKNIQELMLLAEGGNLSIEFQKTQDDEIGNLGLSFNKMIFEIKKLLSIIEEEAKQKHNAELRVLQEQIKPHFLYNTLDTIGWMAIESNEHEIHKMVKALTEFFRISLSNGKGFISLEQELNHIKNYFIIQEIRYEKVFSYVFDIEQTLLNHSVTKIILQPLIENAIYHGIKEKGEYGTITVRAFQQNNDIEIHIIDNGIGLSDSKILELNEMFKSSAHLIGYGLYNVNKRLTYNFGDKYCLKITANANGGITVIVRHPILENNACTEVSK